MIDWFSILSGLYSIFTICLIVSLALNATIYLKHLRDPKDTLPPEAHFPKAAILMGFRGADPHLLRTLKSLMQQNYPEYEIFIVVESQSDPAFQVVGQAIQETGSNHVHLDTYRPSPETGPVSSTNSKQMQSLIRLDSSFGIVVTADGDLDADSNWLKDLITPIVADETVAATYGMRAFVPQRNSLGSLTRACGGVRSLIGTQALNLPWGGCMAVRRSVIDKHHLLDLWTKIIAYDASTPGALEGTGQEVKCLPRMIIPNSESCGLSFLLNYYTRQLLWVRLYHYRWKECQFYMLFEAGTVLGSIAVILTGVIIGSYWVSLILTICYLCLILTNTIISTIIFHRISPFLPEGNGKNWLNWKRGLMLFPANFVYSILIQFALLSAITLKKVKWRGLTMEIRSPTDIRVVKDSGMKELEEKALKKQSL